MAFPCVLLALLVGSLTGCTTIDSKPPPAGEKKIYLTFDDGPNRDNNVSERLLDVLSAHQVSATFCYIGHFAEENPGIVERAVEEGHELAIHTHAHTLMSIATPKRLDAEIVESAAALRSASKKPELALRLFRPPFGVVTPAVRRCVREHELKSAYVTFFVYDASTDSDGFDAKLNKIKRKLMEHEGGAIVIHEKWHKDRPGKGVDKSRLPDQVEDLIEWAHAEGFEFTLY